MYLPSQGRDVRIRWYFLPAGTPFAPAPFLYSSSDWDLTRDVFPGYGEYGWLDREYANGSPPIGGVYVTGQAGCELDGHGRTPYNMVTGKAGCEGDGEASFVSAVAGNAGAECDGEAAIDLPGPPPDFCDLVGLEITLSGLTGDCAYANGTWTLSPQAVCRFTGGLPGADPPFVIEIRAIDPNVLLNVLFMDSAHNPIRNHVYSVPLADFHTATGEDTVLTLDSSFNPCGGTPSSVTVTSLGA